MNPKPGTERFEKLCDFLTQTMEDSKASRRIRLSAAMRLADLLERQQTSEAAEARRQERAALLAAKHERGAPVVLDTPVKENPADSQLQKARELLDRIVHKAV